MQCEVDLQVFPHLVWEKNYAFEQLLPMALFQPLDTVILCYASMNLAVSQVSHKEKHTGLFLCGQLISHSTMSLRFFRSWHYRLCFFLKAVFNHTTPHFFFFIQLSVSGHLDNHCESNGKDNKDWNTSGGSWFWFCWINAQRWGSLITIDYSTFNFLR